MYVSFSRYAVSTAAFKNSEREKLHGSHIVSLFGTSEIILTCLSHPAKRTVQPFQAGALRLLGKSIPPPGHLSKRILKNSSTHSSPEAVPEEWKATLPLLSEAF